MTSYVQWLATQELHITRTVLNQPIQDSQISDQLISTDISARRNRLQAHGITTRGELNMQGDTLEQLQNLDLLWAHDHSVPTAPIMLRMKQVWLVCNSLQHPESSPTTNIIEICGFQGSFNSILQMVYFS